MKFAYMSFLLLTACQFHPLYGETTAQSVCVSPISEAAGYQLHQALLNHFPENEDCRYTLRVTTPVFSTSDQSISNKDFVTMQRISAYSTFQLLDRDKKTVLSNSVSTSGSSAIVTNPYATMISVEKTRENLIPILADQISLHITAFLDRNNP